ncbi:MAG: hypothetical protein Q8781_01995 [Candidatus Phytoplasma stylosanthis]|uniref:hypothetical protein n=1 Tax=Candidatus Phytoplasma stylosanthis TaxID=2798314 RepID=UPI0029395667|nr:hypothetical protein [Candidatus Phytoplasma stylosanthis]MDV3171057.1 hypothetical protein [Candidatus Phytoplasma stylosanthis]
MFWFKNKKRIFILFFLTVSLLIVIPFYLMKKDHNNPPSETYNIPTYQTQEEKIKKPNYLSKLKYFPKKLVVLKKPIHRLIKFSTKTASLMASLIAIILACH